MSRISFEEEKLTNLWRSVIEKYTENLSNVQQFLFIVLQQQKCFTTECSGIVHSFGSNCSGFPFKSKWIVHVLPLLLLGRFFWIFSSVYRHQTLCVFMQRIMRLNAIHAFQMMDQFLINTFISLSMPPHSATHEGWMERIFLRCGGVQSRQRFFFIPEQMKFQPNDGKISAQVTSMYYEEDSTQFTHIACFSIYPDRPG